MILICHHHLTYQLATNPKEFLIMLQISIKNMISTSQKEALRAVK